jgi:hypothetical protein
LPLKIVDVVPTYAHQEQGKIESFVTGGQIDPVSELGMRIPDNGIIIFIHDRVAIDVPEFQAARLVE